MWRVAIVDDQPVSRCGLAAILDAVADMSIVAAVAKPDRLPWTGDGTIAADVVVCDLFLGGCTPCLDAIRAIARQVPVLAVSAANDLSLALAAGHAGASGYLAKSVGEDVYVAAVRAVAAGEFHLSSQLVELAGSADHVQAWPHVSVRLSDREKEALAYIGGGFTHSQTATRMGVSKATVDTYVSRVRAKLRVGNKAELALAALRHADGRYRSILDRAWPTATTQPADLYHLRHPGQAG